MSSETVKPASWRKWSIVITCVGAVLLGIFWVTRARLDRRMVGTWKTRGDQMTIREDGTVDCFCGSLSRSAGISISSFWIAGHFQIRSSGNHFEVVKRYHDPTTLKGLLKFAQAVLTGDRTESVEIEGTIVSINETAMVLEFQSTGRGLPFARHGPMTGSGVYLRVNDHAFEMPRIRTN